jgi:hypothetical protein
MENTIFKLQVNVFVSWTVNAYPDDFVDFVLAIGVFGEAEHVHDGLLFGPAHEVYYVVGVYAFFGVVVYDFLAQAADEVVAGDAL